MKFVHWKFCCWRYSNWGPLVSEANILPTAPRPILKPRYTHPKWKPQASIATLGEEPQGLADRHRHFLGHRQGRVVWREHHQDPWASRPQGHVQRHQHRRRERIGKLTTTRPFPVLACHSSVLEGFDWHFQASAYSNLSSAINKSQGHKKFRWNFFGNEKNPLLGEKQECYLCARPFLSKHILLVT